MDAVIRPPLGSVILKMSTSSEACRPSPSTTLWNDALPVPSNATGVAVAIVSLASRLPPRPTTSKS